MTAVRPLVIPAAAIMLAAITPGAQARTRTAVNRVWVTTPGPALQTAAVGTVPDRVLPVRPATTLPLAPPPPPPATAGGTPPAGPPPPRARPPPRAPPAPGRPATATARTLVELERC